MRVNRGKCIVVFGRCGGSIKSLFVFVDFEIKMRFFFLVEFFLFLFSSMDGGVELVGGDLDKVGLGI